jgi:hypothetical protein
MTACNNDGKNGKAPFLKIWLGFFAYAVLVALAIQFIILPYIFPAWHAGNGLLKGLDCVWFHQLAVELAEKIHREGWSAWELRPSNQAPAGIAGAIYAITVPKLWTTIPLNAALHATAALVLLRILLIFTSRWRVAILFVLPFLMYPSAVTWYAQNHKDQYSILGAFLFAYGWLLLARMDTWQHNWWKPCKSIVLIVCGTVLCWIVRPYLVDLLQRSGVLLALFVTGACMVWVTRRHFPWYRAALAVILIWFIVYAMNPSILPGSRIFFANEGKERKVDNMVSDRVIGDREIKADNQKFNSKIIEVLSGYVPDPVIRMIKFGETKLGFLARYREDYIRGYPDAKSYIDKNIALWNMDDYVLYMPRAAEIAFLAPFPNMWFEQGSSDQNTLMRRISAFEMIIVYICLLGMPLAIWCFYRRSEFWVIIIFCSSILLIYGFGMPNAGTLYRMRYGYMMILVAVGLTGFYSFWQALQKKRRSTVAPQSILK